MKTPSPNTQAVPEKARHIPWWLTVIGAIATYCTLKYLLPELKPANTSLQQFFQLGPTLAPVFTIPFLLLAAKQLYDKDLPGSGGEEESEDDDGAE